MEIRVENAETPLMKNCFIDTKRFSVAGFFGLTHIEIERIAIFVIDNFFSMTALF